MGPLSTVRRPSPPKVGCLEILATVVEWKPSSRSLLSLELSNLWVGDYSTEHGYDSSGRLIAERDPLDHRRVLVLDYRPGFVAVFYGFADFFEPRALLEAHLEWFRPVAIWDRPVLGVRTTLSYLDGEFGVERITEEKSNGIVTEYVYERVGDGRLVRVCAHSPNGDEVLWPKPGRAAIARALAEIPTLAAPMTDAIRKVAANSKAGLCVLSFTPEDWYVPPLLSWLPPQEVASLRLARVDPIWMTSEWQHLDITYLGHSELLALDMSNQALVHKPRAAEKALVALGRSIEAELRADGFQCVVAALPREVAEGHERRAKKQVSAHEWTLLRSWDLV